MPLRDTAVEAARLHHDACMGEMLSVVQRDGRDIACTSGKTMNASHHHAFLFGRAGHAQIASQKNYMPQGNQQSCHVRELSHRACRVERRRRPSS